MKTKVSACFFPNGKKKVCTSDFITVVQRIFGAGGRRKRRKRRKR